MTRKILEGDTWEFIDPDNGNQGIVYLKHSKDTFSTDIWWWQCWYADGSSEYNSFNWAGNKAAAVDACATKLRGMGSTKTRFKFNPNLKYGESNITDTTSNTET